MEPWHLCQGFLFPETCIFIAHQRESNNSMLAENVCSSSKSDGMTAVSFTRIFVPSRFQFHHV